MMVGGDEGIEADDSSGCLSLWANINNAVDIEDTVVDVADTAGAACGAFTPAESLWSARTGCLFFLATNLTASTAAIGAGSTSLLMTSAAGVVPAAR